MLCLCRYYDVTEGNGALAREGERVVVHYEARWKGVTFMTSRCCHVCHLDRAMHRSCAKRTECPPCCSCRQGMGVTGDELQASS